LGPDGVAGIGIDWSQCLRAKAALRILRAKEEALRMPEILTNFRAAR
jgi:hypothetical protein